MNRITKRWFLNNFLLILIILIVIEILVAFGIKNYYYESVKRFIDSQSIAILKIMDKRSQDILSNLDFEIRSIVQDFKEKNKMDLMVLDKNGEILITSNGFAKNINDPMPDFQDIKSLNEKELSLGFFKRAYNLNGENVIAVTYPIPSKTQEISCLRFVTSVTDVDRQIIIIIIITVVIVIAIVLCVVLSSSYFIQSIVVPVDEIGKTAKRIAQGDFSIRLENKNDDEISDLCDTINYMAQELSVTEKVKNEFISSISHELRTPLTAIKGWTETVASCDPNDQEIIEKGMKVIISETERLSRMVEELLDFSRMQNGNMKLLLTELDLIQELREIIIIFEERAKKENIKLIYEFQNSAIKIKGDKNRLCQVFINIIDNALKYSFKAGQVKILAKINNNFALVQVADNGCGIKAEDIPKIKGKFYKANYSKRGSGIGLAVAEEIIKLHNGFIDIYSEENKGTKVIIQIPILQ